MPALPQPIRQVVRPTTFLSAPRLNRRLGVEVVLAVESFQHTGSFKFRAAYQVAASVPHPRLITASSGNFGQALAYACQLLGKSALVVMPNTSAQVKIEAVREYGAEVDLIDVRQTSRRDRVHALAARNPEAYVASAYDDPLVIQGNATLGEELARLHPAPHAFLTPIGGGGLAAGLLTGLRSSGSATAVYAVEPLLANDAAQSWRAGRLIALPCEPDTLADGARVLSVGQHNWPILKQGLAGVLEVSESHIAEAVRLLFLLANLKVEPTGALAVAGLLAHPDAFPHRCVCTLISGGNVDPRTYCALLAPDPPPPSGARPER